MDVTKFGNTFFGYPNKDWEKLVETLTDNQLTPEALTTRLKDNHRAVLKQYVRALTAELKLDVLQRMNAAGTTSFLGWMKACIMAGTEVTDFARWAVKETDFPEQLTSFSALEDYVLVKNPQFEDGTAVDTAHASWFEYHRQVFNAIH